MKRIKFALKNVAVLALLIISFVACDKDFATIGSDIIGQNNFSTNYSNYEVTAYSRKLNPVQTNGLPVHLLGVYKDPVYGLTTATVVSQLSLSQLEPTFGDDVTLDSVVLTIPYFSKTIEINSEGETIYELDSMFGNSKMKLSIFENNYFLRSFDPNSAFNTPQSYYSNQSTSLTNSISQSLLEGQSITHVPDFYYPDLNEFEPNNKQILLRDEEGEITDRLAPSLRLKLDNQFWQQKILDKEGEPELSNLNNFQNYFRGLYFKIEDINNEGTMMLLNFASQNANITLHYTRAPSVEGGERIEHKFVLNFNGNRVNFLSNNLNFPLQDGNSTTGDEKLYLKGGEGSMAVINLFNGDVNGESTEFSEFKNKYVITDNEGNFVKPRRLINEANLVFYVDQTLVNGQEPERIYLYDINNGTPLIDYYLDNTNNISPNDSKLNHLGKLERVDNEPDGQGIRYKIQITEHINNILLRDSTNVKLGLVVSGNINLENGFTPFNVLTNNSSDIINKIPVSSTVSPRGTILYGNNTTNTDKKLKLEIHYTCLNVDDDCEDSNN